MYAQVILTKHSKAIDMAFTYKIPEKFENSIKVGHKVIVPFGIGSNLTEAFVLSITETTEQKRLKTIHQIVKDLQLTPSQVEMISWMKSTYLCTYSEALSTIIPSKTKLIKNVTYKWVGTSVGLTTSQQELYDFLIDHRDEAEIVSMGWMNRLRPLIKKGLIKKREFFQYDMKTQYKTVAYSNMDDLEIALSKLSKSAKKQRKILEFIDEVKSCDVSVLNRELKCTKKILDKFIDEGYVSVISVEKFRAPEILNKDHQKLSHPLNYDQKVVFDQIISDLASAHKYLLHGVTGSGKTEVYLTLAEEILNKGQQIIILVPEIALTPQMVGKFIKRFGNQIAIMHSKVSPGERYDQYKTIQNGEVSIIIGARSAIFSPCNNLGMIILDEEHENTYKSDNNPKYHTVEVAEYLSDSLNIPMVIASATPSLNSYQKVLNKEYELLEMMNRYNQQPLPHVHLVDMREELLSGNKSMFSELLIEKIHERLEKKEQVILFYNRKGFSTFVSCRMCGYALKCPRCDIALTYHHKDQTAKCSYCDYQLKVPKHCPECESHYFKFFGAGTEKIEHMLHEFFPDARIGRLDSESTRKKGDLEKIIDKVERLEIDILIGTQMVTKGLDFKDVTLVGALSADMSLNLPDFRAPEKTFQLLTQVAGRAGRGEKSGEVVVQTYVPEHYAITSAVTQNYHQFFDEEIQIRQLFNYPPYKEVVNILLIGEREKNTIDSAHNLCHELTRFIHKRIKPEAIEILGPNPALFQKLNNKYRWQIILKFDKIDMVLMRNILHYVCIQHKDKVVRNDVYINININPMSLL